MMVLTHYPVGAIFCDLCGWPIPQGTRYVIQGDTSRHTQCPVGKSHPLPPPSMNQGGGA